MRFWDIFKINKIENQTNKSDLENHIDNDKIFNSNLFQYDYLKSLSNSNNIQKFTPTKIDSLSFNDIFVFGGNIEGHHDVGDAKLALNKFGAIYGQGSGLQGKCYAIPTIFSDINAVIPFVNEFIDFAKKNNDRNYYVTRIGCGIAGFKDEEIAPLFAKALNLSNVYLPESFVLVLIKTQDPDILNIFKEIDEDRKYSLDHYSKLSDNHLRNNEDFVYIKDEYPGYMEKLLYFEKELSSKFDCHLGMEIEDHLNSYLRFWIKKSGKRLSNDELNSNHVNFIKNIESTLRKTCKQCGSITNFNSFLCEECHYNGNREEFTLSVSSNLYFLNNRYLNRIEKYQNKYFIRKDIRYINPLNEFDYAKFGYYFFYKKDLYVISDNPKYKGLDLKNNFINSVYGNFMRSDLFMIKGLYAGKDTGFIDDNDAKIYTGDIIRLKEVGHYSVSDALKSFKKDRFVANENQLLIEVYGVVSSQIYFPEAYHAVLQGTGGFLCYGTEMEIIGNIFYDLTPNKRIDIRKKAIKIAHSNNDPNGFWNIHTTENISENLKLIKTPSFKFYKESNENNL
ncbi:A1S_2505 family phage non-structural protein [Aestuariibaculum lutulentum]|uniref:Macro domain-containing protein n=1 Tax=Aestuariibaculum lutulentum TaxID=2920935 RepID=A0ABS9RGX2_9FLAO|nr:hypothetical protein [Aestuariibaculum lutulentum]MCH4552193.1 hypothetical protein [Aestuariibaculum lutulentum]